MTREENALGDPVVLGGTYAAAKLLDMIAKAGEGTVAGGKHLPVDKVWDVLNGFQVLRYRYLELLDLYEDATRKDGDGF